jgi:GNAT superfamily N-acetyltransferase
MQDRASQFEFRLESLDKKHRRDNFSCGVESLEAYLETQAGQDMKRKANAVFVLVDAVAPATIAGYFTLCAYTLEPGVIPDSARKHLPRYPMVSATLIGRLAVSLVYQGHGVGGMLLARALRIAYENASIVGSSMVVVDAIDDRAARFYAAHGFVQLPESRRLILPIRVLADI